ncbi:MAG: hypothetical protein EOO43_12210 [Flavobacterium sp.]|nr:MAG: hypothetical protein EOO43_12210 [Flavobacterium sp.]
MEDLGIVITTQEIDEIKNNLSDTIEMQSNQKFYPKLKSTLKLKLGDRDSNFKIDDRLPAKGKLSGNLLATFCTDISLLDANIKTAFDKLLV